MNMLINLIYYERTDLKDGLGMWIFSVAQVKTNLPDQMFLCGKIETFSYLQKNIQSMLITPKYNQVKCALQN